MELNEVVLSKLEEVLANQLLSDLPVLTKGTQEILSYLKNRSYKVGLVCNTGRSPRRVLRQVLKRRDILQFFEFLTFSDEQRVRKPNPKIFLHTLESLHSDPATSIHLGDELKSDILGTKKSGMKAGWFVPKQEGYRMDFLPEEKPDFIFPHLISLKDILG